MVDLQQLVGVSSKSLESDQYPEFRSCSLGDVVHVSLPAEVAGEGDTQQPGLVDDFKGLTVWKTKLREEVVLLASIEGQYFGFFVAIR